MHKGHSPTWVPETIHTPFPVSIKSFSRLHPSWLRNTYFVWIWVAPLGNVCGFVIVFPHPRTSLTHAPFYLTDIKSCTPNPCKHGGKCIVQDQSFSCDCAGTGYKGSEYAYFKPTAKYEVHVNFPTMQCPCLRKETLALQQTFASNLSLYIFPSTQPMS